MRNLVRIKFGSHLYGTSTPASDLDFKSVYMPDARAILLQRVKGSISAKREKADGEKNYAGEVDEESFSLQRYLGLMAEGQTVATDVFFAPEWSMTEPPTDEWREIVANRHRLITRKSAAFVGYCRQQANKYGIKGSRVAAARKALATLEASIERHGTTAKLGVIAESIKETVTSTEHMAIVPIEHISGAMMDHWEICGRKLSYSASIKNARDIIAALVKDYGARALQAESQQGVDWKALSHAVRVARLAIEMLTTGVVTFPLPDAAHILAIKRGELPYQEVAAEIEQGLVDVEIAAARSTLQAEPDYLWIDDFVARAYGREIGCGGSHSAARSGRP
jgi:predicted nucleotidyltransferase